MVRIHHGPPFRRAALSPWTQSVGRWFESITAHHSGEQRYRRGLNPQVDGSNPSRPTIPASSVIAVDSIRRSMVRIHHGPPFRRAALSPWTQPADRWFESIIAHHSGEQRYRRGLNSQVDGSNPSRPIIVKPHAQ